MISSPVYNYRQYKKDVPSLNHEEESRIQNIFTAALPLLSFYRPIRTPLSIGLGVMRNVSHLQGIISGTQERNYLKTSISTLQLLLNLSAVALLITSIALPTINPSYGLLLSGVDDIISSIVELTKSLKEKDNKKSLEIISQLITSLLFIAFISYGHIEILASCMLIQVAFSLHKAIDEFRKEHYLEGICYMITSLLTLNQLIPQVRVIEWKWRTHPELEGVLCRDERGFVYLKVKDEIIYELNKIFGDCLPPYFGKGKYGGHITVIPMGELSKTIPISEIGKKIKFNIASCDFLKPQGFAGVSQVSFLSLCSPELDALRSRYGLTPKVNGFHDFHFTFALQYEKLRLSR